MIKHYLAHAADPILAIDFARGHVLVGETFGPRGTGSIRKHYRLRLVDGRWERDNPAPRQQVQCPKLDAESYLWREDTRVPLDTLNIAPVRRCVTVDRSRLKSALTKLAKLTSKSLGVDGLLTLRAHARGLSLTSHGAASLRFDDDLDHPSPGGVRVDDFTDGLGTVVVSAAALLAAIKDQSAGVLTIEVGPRALGRSVQVGSESVWTIDAAPVSTATGACFPSPISAALARALPFVCADAARINLTQALIRGRGDHALVTATDGHRLYEERVDDLPAPVEGVWGVPYGVLKALHSRSHGYQLGFDADAVTVEADGLAVRCPSDGPTFPPSDQVLRPCVATAKIDGRDLPPKVGDEVRAWLSSRVNGAVEKVWLHVTAKPAPVVVQLSYSDKSRARVKTVFTESGEDDADVFAPDTPHTKWYANRAYLADAFAAFDPGSTIRLATDPNPLNPNPLNPIYLTDGKRHAIVMPVRGT